MNPFDAHTMLQGQYEAFIGGGDVMGLATLEFPTLQNVTVPITHTRADNDFQQLMAGQSPDSIIERVEFRASLIPKGNWQFLRKGLPCIFKITPDADPVAQELGPGGLMAGGQIFRFQLRDKNYRA